MALWNLFFLFFFIKESSAAVCAYANCEPVAEFLALSAPHIVPDCASCTRCADLNFPTCTLVHPTDSGPHCVCGNTLPTTCDSDNIRLPDILEHNATEFQHDYVCSFPHGAAELLPPLEVRIPNRVNETAVVKVPTEALMDRKYGDLRFQTFSLYLLNGSETEHARSSVDHLFNLDPFVRIRLAKDGSPLTVEPDDADVNVTNWPYVSFPVPENIPTTVAYSTDQTAHRLIVDPLNNQSVKNVSFLYSRLTPTVLPVKRDGPNYTLIVLIVAGTILLLGLCCAVISCKDKIQHRRYRKSVDNAVAMSHDVESGKSAAVASHPQSYTVVKNGHSKSSEHEKVHLLTNPEKHVESATLPLAAVGAKDRGSSGSLRRNQLQAQTLPIVVTSGPKPVDVPSPTYDSKTDVNAKPRNPANVEADRRKYLQLAKDATVIKAVDLDLLESIGSGEFGVIRRGYVFDRTEAMIHCLRPPHKQPTESAAESLTERLDASVKAGFHPHIVSLLGLCHEADVLYVCLQLETGPNLRNMLRESRSLDQFLQYTNARGRLSLMSPQRLLNIILGIARGMGHLEESQVLHDNLAAVNIVICDNGSPKIGGFGMATLSDLYMRQLEKNHDQLRWLPPETHDTGLFTMKSQTWSFGVVLWEIVTFGATPYYEMTDDDVVQRVAEGYRLPKTSNCSRQLYDLMEQCWRANGDDRPDFMTIQQHIHELNLDPELHISVVYHDGFKYQPIRETWNT